MTARETELLAANAALELEVARLREALEVKHDSVESLVSWCVKNVDKWNFSEYDYLRYAVKKMKEALSTPFTPTTLNALIEKVERRTIERCASFVDDSCAYGDTHILVKAVRALPTGNMKLEELL